MTAIISGDIWTWVTLAVGNANEPGASALVAPVAKGKPLPNLVVVWALLHRQFESWLLVECGHLIGPPVTSVSRPASNRGVQPDTAVAELEINEGIGTKPVD